MVQRRFKIDIQWNKSYTYFLGILDKVIHFERLDLLENCYVYNNNNEKLFGVLYKWTSNQEFIEYEEKLLDNPLCVGHEDYEEYVLYKFKFPKHLQDKLDLFINGKYSLYEDEDKKCVYEFLKKLGVSNADRIKMILNRDASIRKELELKFGVKMDANLELAEAPDMSKELFSNSLTKLEFKTDGFNEGE